MDYNYSFGRAEGFAVAAGMWSWDGWVDDPEIGELKFFEKSWEEGSTNFGIRELKKRKCTADDFKYSAQQGTSPDQQSSSSSLDEAERSSYGFYPLKETFVVSEILDNKSMVCIDEDF